MLQQEVFSLVGFAFVVGIGVLSNFFLHRMSVQPLEVKDELNNAGQFIAERAYENLKTLNNFGPKVVGSDANEIQAFNFILKQLNEIRDTSNQSSEITIDQQVVSGFNFERSVYRNIQNIVVRLQGETDHAVMLNCHFDSVPGSPGASDDIVMCCVMMELLRVVTRTSEKQQHSIIFLFNGSEEEDLQAAHGFITQHRWAKDVNAYINLESTGSDGREILFRSGPKHDWLIRLYRQSVPRPFGQAVAEELFETGVIPSATDFEIFRDDGEIPGLDFAYVDNGWRYHTRYDSVEYISRKSVQHTGENILALMKKMANSEELANPPEGSFAIYFDYLGFFFVSYTKEVGIGLNISISILAVIVPFIFHTKLKLSNIFLVLLETFVSFLTIIISTALSAGVCYLIAVIMNSVDNTMSWFNTIFLSIGIYSSLAVLMQVLTYHLVQLVTNIWRSKKLKNEKPTFTSKERLEIHMNGINLFWACLTIAITALGYRFAYITMALLFVSLCTTVITTTLCSVLPKTRGQAWIFLHLAGHSVVILWLCNMMLQVWELFIPIAAKEYYSNPDTLIALICSFATVICFSYVLPLTNLVKYRTVLYSSLLTVFIASMILSFTSVGSPYSDDKSDPRLQRFRVIHTKRTFYNHLKEETFTDVGFLISAIDRNAVRTLESSFSPENLTEWRDDEKCATNIYCGFPMYRFDRGRYLKGSNEDPPTVTPTKFEVISTTRNSSNPTQLKIDFSLDMSTLTMLYMTPGDGWEIVDSSIQSSLRIWENNDFTFTKITYGKKTDELLNAYVTLESSSQADPLNALTITVVTIDSVFEKAEDYINLMAKLPEWTFAHQHQADVSSYVVIEQ